jgi:hypothetical protein
MAHWSVKVCSSNAARIDFQAGPNKGDNDVFASWHAGGGVKSFPMQDRVQSLNRIYFKATTPGRDQTDIWENRNAETYFRRRHCSRHLPHGNRLDVGC